MLKKVDGILSTIAKVLEILIIVFIFYFTIFYLISFLLKIQIPYDMEWLEGSSLNHVARILDGKNLYVEPSINFIPNVYTPFYFYFSALVAKFIGLNFFTLRAISFLSSWGSIILIFLIVKKETKNNLAAFISAGLFVASYQICPWFDLARIDSLFLFLFLIGLYLLRFGKNKKLFILAGLFFALSFLTKQTALLMFLPITLFYLVQNKKKAIYVFLTSSVIIVLSTLIFDYLTNNWYFYYVFKIPLQIPKILSHAHTFILENIGFFYPAWIIILVYFFISIQNKKKSDFIFYFLLSLGIILPSFMARINIGGDMNNSIPVWALISILLGLSFNKICLLIASFEPKINLVFYNFLLFFVFWQFLWFVPFIQFGRLTLPSENIKEKDNIIMEMKDIKGEIFAPFFDYFPVLAGKKSYANGVAVNDILNNDHGKTADKLAAEIQNFLQQQKFSAIFLKHDLGSFQKTLDQYYQPIKVQRKPFWGKLYLPRK